MKILMLSRMYPSIKYPYSLAFIHARSKIYKKYGNKVISFVPCENCNIKYIFEGITVIKKPFSQLKDIINEYDIDVIALHGPSGQWLPYILRNFSPESWLKFLNKLGVPIVTWIHGSEALMRYKHHYFSNIIPKEMVMRAISIPIDIIKVNLLKKLLSKVDAIVTISEWLKNILQTNIRPNKKIYVIPNPIDTSLFKPIHIEENNINKGISIRAMGWKYGLDIAIKAFSNFKMTTLTIVGNGPLKNYLKNVAKKVNSSVIFMEKWVPHNKLPDLIKNYGYFVAPSRTEGQGVSMCEAMSMGLPIIATSIGGIPEFVINKYNGLLVPPENPNAMRKAIHELITNKELYDELSKNAVTFVRKKLSHEVIYKKEYAILKRAIKHKLN